MITRLIANLENVMSAVSVLNVGDLLIFEKEVILILIKLLNFKNEDKPTT